MKRNKKVKTAPKPVYTRKEPKGPRIIGAKYLASAVRSDQYPEGDTVEIAFIGRSNVGKSSLINSLCNHKGLALVSGSPGKTRTINFFGVESKQDLPDQMEERYNWFLVDLPGYGYAKTEKLNRDIWSSFIADYIMHSPRLMLLCLLIDSRHPDLPIDKVAYDWLVEVGVPVQIVLTKADKLNQNERNKQIRAIEEMYPVARKPILYSSLKHTGRDQLMERINEILVGGEV